MLQTREVVVAISGLVKKKTAFTYILKTFTVNKEYLKSKGIGILH